MLGANLEYRGCELRNSRVPI